MTWDFELVIMKLKSVIELIMPATIRGERVILRSVKSSLTEFDVKQIYEWSRDEEVLRWSGGTISGLSFEAFQAQIRRERWQRQTDQLLFYITTKDDEFIGRVGLFTIDWTKREGEFGISIDKRYWNKRYGREATDLLLRHIFDHTPIKRIYLGTFKDNVRAQRSFAASGFRPIGTISRFLPSEGREVDGVEMEITSQNQRERLSRETK